MSYAALGPGVSQGVGENVFRESEKLYQLHREQQARTRKGRPHGSRLVTRPTDLSHLLDVLDSSTWGGQGEEARTVPSTADPSLQPSPAPAQQRPDHPSSGQPPASHSSGRPVLQSLTLSLDDLDCRLPPLAPDPAPPLAPPMLGDTDCSLLAVPSSDRVVAAGSSGPPIHAAASPTTCSGPASTSSSTSPERPGPDPTSPASPTGSCPAGLSVPSSTFSVLPIPSMAAPPPPSRPAPAAATVSAFTLPAHPGLVLIPGALSPELQMRLIHDSLSAYTEPPANTNHTLRYGRLPGLWAAAAGNQQPWTAGGGQPGPGSVGRQPLPASGERRGSGSGEMRMSFNLGIDGPVGRLIAASRARRGLAEQQEGLEGRSSRKEGQDEEDLSSEKDGQAEELSTQRDGEVQTSRQAGERPSGQEGRTERQSGLAEQGGLPQEGSQPEGPSWQQGLGERPSGQDGPREEEGLDKKPPETESLGEHPTRQQALGELPPGQHGLGEHSNRQQGQGERRSRQGGMDKAPFGQEGLCAEHKRSDPEQEAQVERSAHSRPAQPEPCDAQEGTKEADGRASMISAGGSRRGQGGA